MCRQQHFFINFITQSAHRFFDDGVVKHQSGVVNGRGHGAGKLKVMAVEVFPIGCAKNRKMCSGKIHCLLCHVNPRKSCWSSHVHASYSCRECIKVPPRARPLWSIQRLSETLKSDQKFWRNHATTQPTQPFNRRKSGDYYGCREWHGACDRAPVCR